VCFAWNLHKIHVAALVLAGTATLLALAGLATSGPFLEWLCVSGFMLVAFLAHGLSRRAFADGVVLSVDHRGIFDRRLMSRYIEWQEIEAICPVNTDRGRVIDLRLRWPKVNAERDPVAGPHRGLLPDGIRRTCCHDQYAFARG
jgi:hypothetical protein